MQGCRICWGPQRSGTFRLNWRIINRMSYVAVMASEGREGFEEGVPILNTNSPNRFIGAARFTVDNIAPDVGFVLFRVTIDWRDPLTLWTDVVVFDDIRDLGISLPRRR